MKLISKSLMIAVVLGMGACADGADRSDVEEQNDAVSDELEAPLAQLARPTFPGFGDGGIPGFPARPDADAIKEAIEKLRGAGFPGFPGLGDGGLPGFPGGRRPDADAIKEAIEKLRGATGTTGGALPDADAIAKALKDIAAKLRERGFGGLPTDDKLPSADAIKDFLDKARAGAAARG